MARAKITVTFELEYELNPELYPKGATLEEMIAIDKESYETVPYFLMENEDAIMTVKGEVIEE